MAANMLLKHTWPNTTLAIENLSQQPQQTEDASSHVKETDLIVWTPVAIEPAAQNDGHTCILMMLLQMSDAHTDPRWARATAYGEAMYRHIHTSAAVHSVWLPCD